MAPRVRCAKSDRRKRALGDACALATGDWLPLVRAKQKSGHLHDHRYGRPNSVCGVSEVLAYVAGVLSGVVIEEVARRAYQRAAQRAIRSRLGRLVYRFQRKRRARVAALSDARATTIGSLTFPWVVAAYGPFRHVDIESHFSPNEPPYPDEIERSLAETSAHLAQRRAAGESVPDDYEGYKLIGFDVASRTAITEDPRLILHFTPTRYVRMLATELRVDEPLFDRPPRTIRERFGEVDLRTDVVKEVATFWGIGLAVVTSDRQFVVAERGRLAEAPGVLWPAVGEGASRAKDEDPATRAPDHFKIAQRGMQEELGIPLEREELTWLSLGANSVDLAFGLIGRVDCPFRFDEIEKRRALGASRDAWEATRLHAIEFDPSVVAAFLSAAERPVSPFACIAIVHTLIGEFGLESCQRAFGRASITVSQTFPVPAALGPR